MRLLSLILLLQFGPNLLESSGKKKPSMDYPSRYLKNWRTSTILSPTERKPARTAVLIIAPPAFNNCFVERRWALGRKVWEQYMNIHEDVDCFFVQPAHIRPDTSEQVWLEGNTIYVGDPTYKNPFGDRLLYKTIKAMEWLEGKYTHFIRTNINTFLNLNAVNDYMETHHQSMYTTPLWQNAWYTIGYAIVYSADVAAHMVKEFNRLDAANEELISPYHSDDGSMTALATGVWPFNNKHPFKCCPTLPFGVRQLMCKHSYATKCFAEYGLLLTPLHSAQQGISYIEQVPNTVFLYRTRDGLNLEELIKVYYYMLEKFYPQIVSEDLNVYVKSLEDMPHGARIEF